MKRSSQIFRVLTSMLVGFLFFAPVVFSQDGQMKSKQALKATIEKLNIDMEKAFNDNDMAKVAAFYSDDAEISGDNYRIKGRKNLDNYWMTLKDKGRGWKLDVVEIGGEGEFVYQLGKSDLKYIRQETEARSVTNFIVIWKLTADGSYKIFRDYLTNSAFIKPPTN